MNLRFARARPRFCPTSPTSRPTGRPPYPPYRNLPRRPFGGGGRRYPRRRWARFSRGADHAGDLRRALDSDSRADPRNLPPWRPSPLYPRAPARSRAQDAGEDFLQVRRCEPGGLAQAQYRGGAGVLQQQAGIKRLATETGAGQWGSALALAGRMFGIAVRVYMVKVSYEQKPSRRSMMQTWGAEVLASPTNLTESGRKILAAGSDLARLPRHRHLRGGRRGGRPQGHQLFARERAQSRAAAPDRDRTGSSQADGAGRRVSGRGHRPCGGGSNFGGIAFPFFADKAAGKAVRLVAVEPTSCPTLTKGKYAYDFGDTAGLTPLMKMYTLGHDFTPPGIHAGGLRYHGD